MLLSLVGAGEDRCSDNPSDVSLRIWHYLAERQINRVKPEACRVVVNYLRKQKIYVRKRREDEWLAYLTGVRTKDRAKRKVIQILDSLECERIMICMTGSN